MLSFSRRLLLEGPTISATELESIFGLKAHNCDVKTALDPTKAKCKKLALFGDSKLSNLITENLKPLLDDESIPLGDISMKRERYTMNSTLASYLKYKHEEIYLSILENDIEKREQLNDHSLGTVFEALFYLAPQEKCIEIVNSLIEWVDGEGSQYIKAPLVKFCIMVDSINDGPQLKVENCFSMKEITMKIDEDNSQELFGDISKIMMERSKEAIEKHNETNSLDFIINGKIIQGNHLEEPITVQWKSRSGNYYDQKVFPCCGTLCVLNGGKCKRRTWLNKDSFHSGQLKGSGSKRCGGGHAPSGSSTDHIPKVRAHWSCCYEHAESEGCIRNGYTKKLKGLDLFPKVPISSSQEDELEDINTPHFRA